MNEQQTKNQPGTGKILLRWIIDIAIAVAVALLVVQFILPTIVKETSMLPNFHNNDYLFIYRKAYHSRQPAKGDVVVFDSDLKLDNGKDKLLIKRVIGLPGDHITIQNGDVWINGKKADQSYTKDGRTNGKIIDYVVPKGHVFCMGDNRLISLDSRDPSVGAVPESRIVGRVVFRLYRFSDFGPIRNPYRK